jgi:hypothetical protein
MAVDRPGALKEGNPPDWVAAWLESRRAKAEKKAEVSASGPKAVADPDAVAKRAAQRLERMKSGGEDLSRWLLDQARHGIATWPQQPGTHWRGMASRMVDHQMPALEQEVIHLGGLAHTGEGWPERVAAQMGRLHLRLEALKRFESLDGPLQADLRSTLGWSLDKEEVTADGARLEDDWAVLGQGFTERERLWERRTWLQGQRSGRFALLLDFSHGNRAFEVPWVPGICGSGELLFYPGASPLRALLVRPLTATRPLDRPFAAVPDFDTALRLYALALAANPWLFAFPMAVADVVPVHRSSEDGTDRWSLRDTAGAEVPIVIKGQAWELAALAGGRPLTVFGEWDGQALTVQSCWHAALVAFEDAV